MTFPRALFILFIFLSGCSDENYSIPSQKWNEVILRIESRPAPIQPGMNEFIIIANDSRGGPAHDLKVTLRLKGESIHTQAIQDGKTGVYRRALNVQKTNDAVLEVLMIRGQDEGQLDFNLNESTGAKS